METLTIETVKQLAQNIFNSNVIIGKELCKGDIKYYCYSYHSGVSDAWLSYKFWGYSKSLGFKEIESTTFSGFSSIGDNQTGYKGITENDLLLYDYILIRSSSNRGTYDGNKTEILFYLYKINKEVCFTDVQIEEFRRLYDATNKPATNSGIFNMPNRADYYNAMSRLYKWLRGFENEKGHVILTETQKSQILQNFGQGGLITIELALTDEHN